MWKIQVLVLVLHVLLRTSSAMSRNIGTVRSDVIVTKYGSDDADDSKETEEEPGWMVCNIIYKSHYSNLVSKRQTDT